MDANQVTVEIFRKTIVSILGAEFKVSEEEFEKMPDTLVIDGVPMMKAFYLKAHGIGAYATPPIVEGKVNPKFARAPDAPTQAPAVSHVN